MTTTKSHIVMDNGSLNTRIGFHDNDEPEHIFETNIKQHEKRPIQQRMIVDFEKLEEVWSYSFNDLMKINPTEHNLLFTEPALYPKANREKSVQILFEKFEFHGSYTAQAPTLALYTIGKTTGMVVDSGYEMTQIVPIYEGYALPHAVAKMYFGGKNVTEYLQKLMGTESDTELMPYFRDMKEKYAYIAADGVEKESEKPICSDYNYLISGFLRDIDSENMKKSSLDIENICDNYCGDKSSFLREIKQYKLPDGKVINLKDELFRCTELLFDPELIDISHRGIDKRVGDKVIACDIDIRQDFLGNIVLCGGNSMFKGFADRIERGLLEYSMDDDRIDHKKYEYKVMESVDETRKDIRAWVGGNILVSLDSFEDMWMIKEEYDEAGPAYVHRHCT